ncbi:MAG: hypothetical protein AWU58_1120 [Methanohalophilus sp. T328-1]|uniref:Uncharacterized protein n=1 Tax=Methanohalophilus euhalobius TaxID=51203 RepID=A0A285G0L8_9EURY|nr:MULTISPECIES: hypothetical protein [Methanohalophilus]KXS44804.1 MAG: hypothetical protein AWU58_1120 [Methanohalophilus sp. T328-1]RSD34045.1 MAG: hypothetical protein CI952_1385 [Methanohalophilus sp.]OBZ34656.1 MAG: hypothetical protein A9957_09845 [Methanohalophilus sp. DAL1]ODV48753.1 MAG: hypothetical protein A8273_1966 [Methanohalophilus sp. 2-GBenrich]RSD34164.1 MAG: hypothetical protein CI953_1048 [Methanohalophilus sp.]
MASNKMYLFVLLMIIGAMALSGCSSGDPGVDDIPSEYEETRSINLGDNISLTQYEIETQDSSQVLNDLQQTAESEGWEVIADWEGDFAGYKVGVALEKDDRIMGINTAVNGNITTATVITGPRKGVNVADMNNDETSSQVAEEEPDAPPTTDVDGQDFADAPRYPDSVRTDYTSLTTGSDVTQEKVQYLTSDNPEDVKIFYENELEAQGWENIQSQMLTEKGDVRIYVTATKDSKTLEIGTQPSSDYDDMDEILIYVETRTA